MIGKSALASILPPSKQNQIMQLFYDVERNGVDTPEAYYFLMNAVNALISDDHSHVHLEVFMHQHDVRYSGVVFSLVGGEFKVIHSVDERAPLDSSVLKINGQPASRYIAQRCQILSKPTQSDAYRIRRTAMTLSIYNPYDTVNELLVEDPVTHRKKRVTL